MRIEAKLVELLGRTEELLAVNRVPVLAVAHALETNKTVTGEDAAAVIEGVEGPILDGRGYHTDEFAEAAERYHAMVVAAHKGHAKVEAPMPALRPYELVGAAHGAEAAGATDHALFEPPHDED